MKLTFFFSFLILSYNLFAQPKSIQSTSGLISSLSSDESIFVNDPLSGGLFIHSTALLPIDTGIVFPRRAGGVWVRYFDKSAGVNPDWWGAVGDGIHDDLQAIIDATDYCQKNKMILQFPSGVFRITAPWVVGAKTLDEEDLFSGALTEVSSFRMQQHQEARRLNPMIIRGNVNTCIYGDFKATKLTAIVYYNINAGGPPNKPSSHLDTHEFSNIGIYGEGFFKGLRPAPPDSVDLNNKQIGLVMLFCNMAKINHCNFSDLEYGLVCNTTYFTNIGNCEFRLCKTGLFTRNFNANLIENLVAFSCKLAVQMNGSQITINNLNSEYCESTLAFNGVNVVLNGVYCETEERNGNTFQLIFGGELGDEINKKRSITTNVIINGLTLTANGSGLILLGDNMKDLYINGANINGPIISKSTQNNITAKNLRGSYKFLGPGKLKEE